MSKVTLEQDFEPKEPLFHHKLFNKVPVSIKWAAVILFTVVCFYVVFIEEKQEIFRSDPTTPLAFSSAKALKSFLDNGTEAVSYWFVTKADEHGWIFKGLSADNRGLIAFFKVPKAEVENASVQQRYLQHHFCPSADQTSLWSQVQSTDILVVLEMPSGHQIVTTCLKPS